MEARTALRKFFGGLLAAVGILLALTCGLCTGFFGIMTIGSMLSHRANDIATIGPFLMLGCLFSALGAGLAWVGFRMFRG